MYVLVLTWLLVSGQTIDIPLGIYAQKYHCLHILTKYDKVIVDSKWQHLRCKELPQ